MAKIINLPIMQGSTVENQTTVGTVRIKASDKQAQNLHLGVLLPNYEPQPDGSQKVTSYSLVARTEVLKPHHLKALATMEARGAEHYERLRTAERGLQSDTQPEA